MRDETLLYWGMVVSMFLLIAAILTARQLFENYLEDRAEKKSRGGNGAATADPPVTRDPR